MELSLNNGIKCPAIGLGTWQSTDDKLRNAIREALDSGYRHIDTAYNYTNEAVVGEVVREFMDAGKVKRENIFITTKLPMIHTRPSDVAMSLEMSLKSLQMDYVDLYLIHFPIAFKNRGPAETFPMENGRILTDETDLEGVWKAMEELVKRGKAKCIGVSNFNCKQIERICKTAEILPVTNQVECHAYFPQKDLAEFCDKWRIVLTAYSPLGSPGRPEMPGIIDSSSPTPLEDKIVKDIAVKYNKTPAQILIRWLLQRNMIVIPKSVSPTRIKENIKVFDFSLTDSDMKTLGNMPNQKRLFPLTAWSGHVEFPF